MNTTDPDHERLSKTLSIRQQLLTYVIAIMFGLLLLFAVVISWLVTAQTSSLIVGNAQQVARALGQQAVLALITESEANAEIALEQVTAFPDVAGAGLITTEGRLLGWRGSDAGKQYFVNYPWDEARKYLLVHEAERSWHVAAAIILAPEVDEFSETQLQEKSEEKLGYAVLTFSKRSLYDVNRDIVATVAIAGLIAMIALVLSVGSIIQKLLTPLQALSQVMVNNQQTGEHGRAEQHGSLEIQQMASSFNAMMDTLDEQDERLRYHRDLLEAEVKIRTRELVEARDAALTSNRHKSEFLANLTHELRTPIQSIVGYVDLVREEAEDHGVFELHSDLDKVTRNAERLLNMVDCMLDLSKIEAGKMEVSVNSIYLNDLLTEVKDAVAPLIPKNGNSFSIDNTMANTLLRTDREKLLQVLINLISNAAKFTHDGEIALNITGDSSMLHLEVKDTGIGIPEEKLEAIFEEFTQVDSGTDRNYGGTGLGLAISKQFCQLMGANLSVTSTLGTGSSFKVIVPLQKHPSI